ncbi:MAG: hypothetical protein PUE61_03025 [Clostridiales bacterium]|nr:hypothetical protein [Clostridiales bacterium]
MKANEEGERSVKNWPEAVKFWNRGAGFRAKKEAIEFEPILTNAIGYSAKEWCENATNRAALAVLLMMDCKTAFGDLFAFDLFHEVFLERAGNDLFLAFYSDSERLTICYYAFRKRAAYSLSKAARGEMNAEEKYDPYRIEAKDLIACLADFTERIS